MDNNFDQSIFGQLISPQPLSNNQILHLSSYKITDIGSPTPSSSQQKSRKLQGNKNWMSDVARLGEEKPDSNSQQKISDKMRQKQFSSRSTNIENENRSQSQKNFIINIKNLSNRGVLQCIKCQKSEKNQKCIFCHGTNQISGNDNILKFIRYIMEFKLYQRNSYNANNQKKIQLQIQQKVSSISETPNFCYQTQRQGIKNRTFQQLKDRIKKQSSIHAGYECNKCSMNPIVGIRHHCPSIECNDDFDLCNNCYFTSSHAHQMLQIIVNQRSQIIQKFAKSEKFYIQKN